MKRTYWILAGHGGADPGAVAAHGGITYREADLALEMRQLVSERLRKHGCTVNNEGNATPLVKVVQWLKADVKEDDIVLDIHFNAAGPDAIGTLCLTPVVASDLEKAIAQRMTDAIAKVGFRARKVGTEADTRHGLLGVMRNSGHTVLLEVCFITSQSDIDLYNRRKQDIADAIATTLMTA